MKLIINLIPQCTHVHTNTILQHSPYKYCPYTASGVTKSAVHAKRVDVRTVHGYHGNYVVVIQCINREVTNTKSMM